MQVHYPDAHPTARPPRRVHRNKYAGDRSDRSCHRAGGDLKRKLGEAQAEATAANMNAEGKGPVHAYRCPRCDSWHVGRVREASPAGRDC